MAAKSKSNPKPAPKKPNPATPAPVVKPARAPRAQTTPRVKAAPLTQTFGKGYWRQHWLPMLLLVAAAFALYGASIQYGYILDDEMVVWKNAFVQKGFAGWRNIFGADSFMGYFQDKKKLFLLEGGRYRPLSLATFAAEVGIWGDKNPNLPHISHFINIFLYGLSGAMLYRILAGLFPLSTGGKWYTSIAFFGALIFVVHPLHSECVANIKGRDEILALMGCLGAVYATLKYFDSNRIAWLFFSAFCLLLGMLSKENALTFLVVIPLTVWAFTAVPLSRIGAATIPLLMAVIIFVLVRYNALGFMLDHGKAVTDVMNDPFIEMTLMEKFATIFLTLGWYLKLLFIPFPLTHDYYPYHVPKVGWTDWKAIASLVVYLAMGIWAVLNIPKKRVLAYSILYWIVTLSIVSNLVVSVGSFMNERFAYMPSVAFCIAFAWFFAYKLPDWIKEQKEGFNFISAVGVVSIALIFAGITINRVPAWKDAMSLNVAAVHVSTNSARAHSFYVTSIYTDRFLTEKDNMVKKALIDTMQYHIKRALEINPNYASALVMRSAVAAAQFEQDHQLDKFFHEIEFIANKIPYNTNFRDFLDQYMKYLNGSNSDKYISFCHRMGYEFYWKEKQDPTTALHFLQFGLDRQTEDYRILLAMAEIYRTTGDTAKAAEMQARYDAQQ
jgi:hypothetical protein